MSDYVRNKSVMYPIDEELAEKLDNECKEQFYIEVFDDGSKENYYLCYRLYHTYGIEFGDFGRSRTLNKTEQEKYKKLFLNHLSDIDITLFKYVDYCWFDCRECNDYYLNESDDFYNDI